MGAVLTASAVWCALSVLFAGVHGRWMHYAPAGAGAGRLAAPPRGPLAEADPWESEGAEVSAYFASYAVRAGRYESDARIAHRGR